MRLAIVAYPDLDEEDRGSREFDESTILRP